MLWIDGVETVFERLRHAGVWLARPRLLWLRLVDAHQLHRTRRQLAALDSSRLADIGVTREQVDAELDKPFIGELSPWAALELRAEAEHARRFGARHNGACHNGAWGLTTAPPPYERSFYRSRGRRDLPQKY